MALSAHWQHHIEAWQASGLSQAAYCRQHGLNPNTFSGRWHHFKSLPPTPSLAANPDPAPQTGLIPVQLTPQPTSLLVLQLAAGHRLELPASVAPGWLAELLRCLG